MNVQIIKHKGTPEYAVIPYTEFERLREAAETLDDIQRYDHAMRQIAEGEAETFPAEFVNRLLAGEHALRVWREYRGLTLAALGKTCGVSAAALSQIEKGKREPSAALLRKLATALHCDMDDLLPAA
ncbi:MAG: helix-turn-helix transcriptional regulator [Thermodesulfobacteriota bacterium]|jgi:DNA-binding XRE family transcriptional regulator